MPRAKTRRRMRPNEREALAAGLTGRWSEGDTAESMAIHLGTSKRRVVEALQIPFGEIRPLVRNRATERAILDATGYSQTFVAYAMRTFKALEQDQLTQRIRNRPIPYEEATRGPSGPRVRLRSGGPKRKRPPQPKRQHDVSDAEKAGLSLDTFLKME